MWQDNVLPAQKVGFLGQCERLSYLALVVCCGAGKIPLPRWLRQYPAGQCLASLRRFWAVAARRNSSIAPHGPRNRNLPNSRMRLRWAKSISERGKGSRNRRSDNVACNIKNELHNQSHKRTIASNTQNTLMLHFYMTTDNHQLTSISYRHARNDAFNLWRDYTAEMVS